MKERGHIKMPKSTKKGLKPHPTSYEEFLRSLKLVGLAVSDAHYWVNRDAYFDAKDQRQVIELKAEQSELAKDFFDMSATLRLSVSSEKQEVLSIKVTYLLHIHTPFSVVEEYVDRFAGGEIRLVVWPYLREFVTSACGRMYVPPIFLPLPGSENEL